MKAMSVLGIPTQYMLVLYHSANTLPFNPTPSVPLPLNTSGKTYQRRSDTLDLVYNYFGANCILDINLPQTTHSSTRL